MTGFTQRLFDLSSVDGGAKGLNAIRETIGHCQDDCSVASFCVWL